MHALTRPTGPRLQKRWENKLEGLTWRERSPTDRKFAEARSDPCQILVRKLTRRRHSFRAGEGRGQLIELGGGSDGASCALRRKRGDEVFHFECFIRQSPTRAFPSRLIDVPAFGDQSVKAAAKSKLGLHRIVSEIVERKERCVFVVLALPGCGAIGANASQQSAAISSFCELQNQGAAVSKPPKS